MRFSHLSYRTAEGSHFTRPDPSEMSLGGWLRKVSIGRVSESRNQEREMVSSSSSRSAVAQDSSKARAAATGRDESNQIKPAVSIASHIPEAKTPVSPERNSSYFMESSVPSPRSVIKRIQHRLPRPASPQKFRRASQNYWLVSPDSVSDGEKEKRCGYAIDVICVQNADGKVAAASQ